MGKSRRRVGETGEERGGGDPEKTEGGNLAPSGIWTKSRFGKLWAGFSREVALENRERELNILNNGSLYLGTQDSSCRLPPSPRYCTTSTLKNVRTCELYLCYCFEVGLSASRSSERTY